MEALSSSEVRRVITDLTMPKPKNRMQKWRVGGPEKKHAVMVPDVGFTKQLKKLDQDYDVVWDQGSCKWEIWKFPKEFGHEPYHVTTIQTSNRSYRELGTDVLIQLNASRQLSEKFTFNQLADYFDEMDDQIQRRKASEFKAKIETIARDTFTNIHCMILQVPRSYKIGRACDGRV